MKDKLCNVCDYDGVPENRANYDILLNSLDLHNISDDFQICCDFKLINILIGIQTCASRYRGLKVKRNIGSDEHLKRALKSHIFFNSLRVGSPDRDMTIRRNSPKSPLIV